MSLNIQPGKFYRTRNSHKVRIYAIDGCKLSPIHGAYFSGGEWIQWRWSTDGSAAYSEKHVNDLISEWQDEPKPITRAMIREAYTSTSKSALFTNADNTPVRYWEHAPRSYEDFIQELERLSGQKLPEN